ncbi:unnamed protein product [Urochloa humidicola]
MATALPARLTLRAGIYFSTNLHARTYAGIATAVGSPFSDRVGIVPNKQRAQQVRCYKDRVADEFKVKLLTPDGEETITMPSHKYILQAALNAQIKVPYQQNCQSGNCDECIAKLIEGRVEHDENTLEDEALKKDFVVLCRARPRSDVVIQTNIDTDDLYN